MIRRKISATEAKALAMLTPTWVHTFNTICEPPVTLWCEGEVVKMRAVHNDGRFGTTTETEYEVIDRE